MRTSNERGRGTGGYRKLRACQAGVELVECVYDVTASFPASERLGLMNQMRRAAVSIPCNLAEGNERIHRRDKLRFVVIARASVAELETQLEIAVRLGFVTADAIENVFVRLDGIGRMLSKLRNSLSV